MVRDNSQPALVRIVGKEILSWKGFDVIEKILDRGIGKPTQNVEMKQIQDKDMTPEETRDFVISTLKELKKRDE